jgi:hypothetical protein
MLYIPSGPVLYCRALWCKQALLQVRLRMCSPAFADVSMTHLVATLWHLAFAPARTQAAAAGLYVGQGYADGDFSCSVLHPPLQEGVYLTVSGMSHTVELLVAAVFQAWGSLVDSVLAAASATEGEGEVVKSESLVVTDCGLATAASALKLDGTNGVAGGACKGGDAARPADIDAVSSEGGKTASVGGDRADGEGERRGQAALARYNMMLTAAVACATSFADVRTRLTSLE